MEKTKKIVCLSRKNFLKVETWCHENKDDPMSRLFLAAQKLAFNTGPAHIEIRLQASGIDGFDEARTIIQQMHILREVIGRETLNMINREAKAKERQ